MTDDVLIQKLVGFFSKLPQVEAIALGGSRASGRADAASDIDLYVFTTAEIPLEVRRGIVQRSGGASVADMGLDYFGAGDEWRDAETGTQLDVMYFDLEWMRGQIERVMEQHEPSLGYSTAFCYTVSRSRSLYDPQGRFAALQAKSRRPYPDVLRQAIVEHNYPLLRAVISSYRVQLEKAAARQDIVSLNHRLAALMASYFDIIFAVNRVLHPGEKRLLATTLTTCKSLPENFEQGVTETLAAGEGERLLPALTRLLDALDEWLEREGFDVTASRPVRLPVS